MFVEFFQWRYFNIDIKYEILLIKNKISCLLAIKYEIFLFLIKYKRAQMSLKG